MDSENCATSAPGAVANRPLRETETDFFIRACDLGGDLGVRAGLETNSTGIAELQAGMDHHHPECGNSEEVSPLGFKVFLPPHRLGAVFKTESG